MQNELEYRGGALAAGTTRFLFASAEGGAALPAAESLLTRTRVRRAKGIGRLRLDVGIAPGAGQSITATVYDDGGATARTVAVTEAGVSAETSAVPISAGEGSESSVEVVASAGAADPTTIRALLEIHD